MGELRFKDLVFHEITDSKTQACVKISCGWQIQITFEAKEGCYDATLYGIEGGIMDSQEGMDSKGVDEFLKDSEKLFEDDYKYWEEAFNNVSLANHTNDVVKSSAGMKHLSKQLT